MSCEQIIEYIQRDLDDDLSCGEAAKLEEHLRICSDCRRVRESLRRLNQQLIVLPDVDPPISIVDNLVLPQIEGENKVQVHPGFFTRFRKPLSFAGCAAIIFASLWGVKDHFAKVTKENRQVALSSASTETNDLLAPELHSGETARPSKIGTQPRKVTRSEEQKPVIQPKASGSTKVNKKITTKDLPNKAKVKEKVEVNPLPENAVAIVQNPTKTTVTESPNTPLIEKSDKAPMLAVPKTTLENEPTLAAPKTMMPANRTLAVAEPTVFPSPYGPLVAKVDGNSLIVADELGKTIYQSHKWEGMPKVSVQWINENDLVYELAPAVTGKMQTFQTMMMPVSEKWTVDLKVGQEQKE
jgi:hypothetical protein